MEVNFSQYFLKIINKRMNKFFNNPEFIVNDVKEVDLDGLIS
jgi:hypothetical protein